MGPGDARPGGSSDSAASDADPSRFRPTVAATGTTSRGTAGGPRSEPAYGAESPRQSAPGTVDLGWAQLDVDRLSRTGDPEVVFGLGKTPHQVVTALNELSRAHPDRAVLATRLSPEAVAAVKDKVPAAEVGSQVGIAVLGPLPPARGRVLVLTGGTADRLVAAEAAVTARVHGADVERVDDVGVAGLHRLLAIHQRLQAADCVIAVAGMEGSLPSVVGGLTGVPVVAVPTSVGYGVTAGGTTALHAMLGSCAPGVVVVNIDNGFGAGVHAARVVRAAVRAATG